VGRDHRPQETDAIGELYRVDADGTAHRIADGFI
jgi:hypothetical protein